MKTTSNMISFCYWLLAVLTVSATSADAKELLSGHALVYALRQGGYVIYFRHATTDWSQEDQVSVEGDWTSCDPDRMRQLSDDGRTVARRIGEAIRSLKIPVGRVLSSEYCRTRETAQLMNIGSVEPTRTIMNMRVADMVGGPEAVTLRAQQHLGNPPKPGTNTVIVAHGNLMRAATGEYTDEAGAGVFVPLGAGKFRLVALLPPTTWQLLIDQFGK